MRADLTERGGRVFVFFFWGGMPATPAQPTPKKEDGHPSVPRASHGRVGPGDGLSHFFGISTSRLGCRAVAHGDAVKAKRMGRRSRTTWRDWRRRRLGLALGMGEGRDSGRHGMMTVLGRDRNGHLKRCSGSRACASVHLQNVRCGGEVRCGRAGRVVTLLGAMPTLQQVTHTVKANGTPTVLEVTVADGRKYEVKLAILVPLVLDTGMVNPIDNTPILNIPANVVVQVSAKSDA